MALQTVNIGALSWCRVKLSVNYKIKNYTWIVCNFTSYSRMQEMQKSFECCITLKHFIRALESAHLSLRSVCWNLRALFCSATSIMLLRLRSFIFIDYVNLHLANAHVHLKRSFASYDQVARHCCIRQPHQLCSPSVKRLARLTMMQALLDITDDDTSSNDAPRQVRQR